MVIFVDSLIDSELFSGRVGFEILDAASTFSFEVLVEGCLISGFLIWGIGTDFFDLLKLVYLTGILALVGVNCFLLWL